MTDGPFGPVRTLLSQQTYPGARRLKVLDEGEFVNPPDGRGYTPVRAECPECGATGRVKSYGGTNCFWDCRSCGQALRD